MYEEILVMKYRRMKKALVLILLFTSLISYAQDKDSFLFGLYLRDEVRDFERIDPSSISGMKGNVDVISFDKPSMSLFLNGAYSSKKTKHRQPEFLFFFNDEERIQPITTSNIGIMIKNFPFVYGASPKQFTLVRLFKVKERRAMRLESQKALSTATQYAPMSIDTIPFTVISISKNAFKVILDSELPLGEYGFIYKESTPYGRIIYDFSIEE